MAAAKKDSKKKRKNSFLCFFRGCFGISNKVSAEHGDGKPVKKGSTASGRHGRAPPAKIPTTLFSVKSSKEIHVVKESQNLAGAANELSKSNKTQEISTEKCKNEKKSNPQTNSANRVNKQNGTVQESWSKPTKLSHSVSLPLLCQRTDKPPPVGGGAKGKKGREVEVAGEFDSVVGAVIITVTLLVMLIWGKIWAILSTAAWFYFIPRFRKKLEKHFAINLKNGGNQNGVDLDSREYKKKVVLQGLLERNQQL